MNTEKKTILIIDDDIKLCGLLLRFLQERGYNPRTAHTGNNGLSILRNSAVDLVILDVMMPGEDGFETLKIIRKLSNIPVIMLTARKDHTDRILGLELGADDYIGKPFEPAEIDARIRAIFRRIESPVLDTKNIRFEHFEFNPSRRSLNVNNREIPLSAAEYRLLEYFISNSNIVLSRDQITEYLKGEEFDSFNRSVDVLVSRLRKKLNDDSKEQSSIKTVHGHGYLFIAKVIQ